MDVTWTIAPTATGSRVDIHHDFRRTLPIPVIGPVLGDAAFPAFVDRWFTRPIAGRTLATFKALAEAVASTPTHGQTSAEPSPTNPPT
jgi:hypothetical protein